MTVAVISDIHANLPALRAVLADIDATAPNATIWHTGDIVGYNADPAAVIERIADLVDSKKAIAVVGNHDEAVFKDYRNQMNAHANATIEWTKTQLQQSHVQ